ncbi:Autophagy protein Atg8 ubiquitin [uncultured virus]|nr:Autophagy protein Atg8 ubiquitin [uncultured virus]
MIIPQHLNMTAKLASKEATLLPANSAKDLVPKIENGKRQRDPQYVDPAVRSYVRDNSFEKRVAIAKGILQKHRDKIPVIVGRGDLKETPVITKCKYLTSRDTTFGKFCMEVRKNIPTLVPQTALFFFVGDTLPTISMTMEAIYEKYKSDDGSLYVTYTCENTFGYCSSMNI